MESFYYEARGDVSFVAVILIALIGLMIFSMMSASLMPTVISGLNETTNSTGVGDSWDGGLKGMWDMTPIMVLLAVVAIPLIIVIRLLL